MAVSLIDQAIEAIYHAMHDDNNDIDRHIAALKDAMKKEGVKEATFKPERLPVPNREGRLLMKSYFKKRGVPVKFEKE